MFSVDFCCEDLKRENAADEFVYKAVGGFEYYYISVKKNHSVKINPDHCKGEYQQGSIKGFVIVFELEVYEKKSCKGQGNPQRMIVKGCSKIEL